MFRKTSKIAVVFILTISLVLSFASFTALALNEDVTPPQLTKVEATSASVRPGDSINITVYATDSSGIDADDCYVRIARIPKSDSEVSRFEYAYFEDKGDGKFVASFHVTDDWTAGDYEIQRIGMSDQKGNNAGYYNDSYSDPDNLIPDVVFSVVDSEAVEPSESPKPSETVKPSESPKPSETVKPSESPKPSETVKPSESPKPSETVKPSESPKPSETVKPSESPKPSETVKPSESPKPSETVKPSESPKPVDPVIPDDHSDNCPSKPYSDMKNTEGKWFHESVDYAISNGYMTGVENNLFAPNRAVSRAMVAQILYAAEEKPAVTKSAGFSDVKAGKWYTNAVNWTASKGVVAGYPDGSFKPDKDVTREELATILYKYAQTKTDAFGIAEDALERYPDKNQIHTYAVNAIGWAVSNKIISGTNVGLEPRGTATRAQLAVMIQAFDKAIKK